MIKAKDLYFSYDKDKSFITKLNVEIEKGKITTILGPNGSGKSTLLSLFAGLNKPNSGDISINGKSIKSLKQKELAREIATVHQQNTVPSDITVKELVAYGRIPHKKYFQGNTEGDDEIIEWAIKRTGLENLKDKAVMGMSGGERQRISIARAFLKIAPIIILDEIAASLDVDNEKKIQESLNELTKNKTVIIISHRLKSIENVDKIVVIDNGEVEAFGNHKELISISKTYNNLVEKAKLAEVFKY